MSDCDAAGQNPERAHQGEGDQGEPKRGRLAEPSEKIMGVAVEQEYGQNTEERNQDACQQDAEGGQAKVSVARLTDDEREDQIARPEEHRKHRQAGRKNETFVFHGEDYKSPLS